MKSNIKFFGFMLWLLCAIFFLYEFFLQVCVGAISVNLVQEFSLEPTSLALVSSFYYFAYSMMQIPAGMLLDKYGVQRMLLFSISVCVLGVFIFSFAHSYYLLLGSRFLMGAGSAFAFPGLLMIAVQYFSNRHYGIWMGATQITGAIGPILAGAPFVFLITIANGSWRTALIIVACLGVVLLSITALFTYLHGHKLHAKNPHYFEELSSPSGLKIAFKNKQLIFIAVFAFLCYAAIPLLGTVWGVIYMQTLGLTQMNATKVILFLWLGLSIGSPVVGWLADKINNYKFMLMSCMVLGLIVSILLILFSSNNRVWMGFLFFLIGLSGGAQTLTFALLARHVPKSAFGISAGINNTAVMLGGVVIPPVVGVIVKYVAPFRHRLADLYTFHNIRPAFVIMPVVFILSIVIASMFLKNNAESVPAPK